MLQLVFNFVLLFSSTYFILSVYSILFNKVQSNFILFLFVIVISFNKV